jgi:hypothetical protein
LYSRAKNKFVIRNIKLLYFAFYQPPIFFANHPKVACMSYQQLVNSNMELAYRFAFVICKKKNEKKKKKISLPIYMYTHPKNYG